MIRRFQIVLCGFLLLFLLPGLTCGEEYIDRVVAVVNDDVITLSELEKAGQEYFQRIRQKAPANEVERALENARKEVLSSLIDNAIVKQKAAELSITVDEAEIDNAVNQMLSRNNATLEEFKRELAKVNVSVQDYRENIRGQILQSKLVGYQVRSRIVVIEDDIREYYEKAYTQEKGEGGYHILQMGINWEKKGTPEEIGNAREVARAQAEEIRARVLAGESFQELAQSLSSLPSAADGGDIGLIKKDEMAAYMKDAILPLHPGEISQIIETEIGFQFFKLLSVREGDLLVKAPYESVKDEIRDILYRQEMEEQYKAWVESIRAQAYIQILL